MTDTLEQTGGGGRRATLEHLAEGFETRAIHAGVSPQASATPIHVASTGEYGYSRSHNETVEALEECVSTLEGARHTLAMACGMAAVTQTFMALLKSGDRVVFHRDIYVWTEQFLVRELVKFGVQAVPVDFRDFDALEVALKIPTRVLYFEPLSNPGLNVVDVRKVAEMGRRAGAVVVVDNSFLSPALLRPLELGVDVVLHSATKFLCGHGDALGGVVSSNDGGFIRGLQRVRSIYGGVLSPFNAFLILRGIATLAMRMRQHGANAQRVAEFLAQHPAVAETRYPGLPHDPGHAAARTMLDGFGGVVGFVLKGGHAAAGAFKGVVKLCKPWASLGDTSSLVNCPNAHPDRGVPAGYVRVAVGLEDVRDIIADLERALKQVHGK